MTEYEPGRVFECQDLYCVDRLTFEAVAERTGVSVATLKRWSDKFSWREKREKLAQAESRIRTETYQARLKMIDQVVAGGGALEAFAVAKLETLALEQARYKREIAGEAAFTPPAALEAKSPASIAVRLEKALGAKLGGLVAEPSKLDLKAVRDLRAALALVAEMKAKAGATGTGAAGTSEGEAAAGLTPETEAKIKKILAEGL